jgi:metalloendopeptidase OMA1, mitochondrial
MASEQAHRTRETHLRVPMAGCQCQVGVGRRAFLSGAAIAATLPLAGCDAAVPDWLADVLVPEGMAAELGLQAFRDILRETPPVRDPGLQQRVARTGQRIVEASASPYRDWRIVVLDSPQINAFALPGGYVGVYAGMLQVAANEAQLATVLGHEVGHVNARHGAQRIVAKNAVALALRLGTTFLALSDSPIPPDLVAALGGTAADLGLIRPFSRSQELEADELGLRYMARVGHDPAEAIAFWQRMTGLERGSRVPGFLSTHPTGERRIEELKQLVATIRTGS